MSTPYDGRVYLVSWLGRTSPGTTIADSAKLLRQKAPNVGGIILKVANGKSWQGHLANDQSDPKAVTGTVRIQEYVDAYAQENLDVHVWTVPRAKVSPGESLTDASDIESKWN
jgi:hypothetical protein